MPKLPSALQTIIMVNITFFFFSSKPERKRKKVLKLIAFEGCVDSQQLHHL